MIIPEKIYGNRIDGKSMAQEILARAKTRASLLPYPPKVTILVTDETPATKSYLSIKEKRARDAGCVLNIIRLSKNISTAALRAAVLSADADAIIIQLPLPASIDTKYVCDSIPTNKDADVLSDFSRNPTKLDPQRSDLSERSDLCGSLVGPKLLPPVAGAVREIFIKYNVDANNKKAVVIGNGWLVGNPCAVWLKEQGADVSVITRGSVTARSAPARSDLSERSDLAGDLPDLAELILTADIIISGAGSPHLIKPEMLKEGVILIDAGTSESGGAIVGDADPSCIEKCSLFTPVPGGIGPIAVALLFENVITLAEGK